MAGIVARSHDQPRRPAGPNRGSHPGGAGRRRRGPGSPAEVESRFRLRGGCRRCRAPFYDQGVKWLAARAATLPPRLQDLALALVLAAVNVGTVLPYRASCGPRLRTARPVSAHPLALALALLVLQALPLVWRRSTSRSGCSWPSGLPRSVYDQLGFGYAPVPLGPAIAYFTVMQRCSTGVRWAISVVLLAGIVSVADRARATPSPTTSSSSCSSSAWPGGGPAQPEPHGLPGRGRGAGRAGRGRARPAGRAGRRRGARPDRQGTARRGGAPRQPDGGAGRGGRLAAAGPARAARPLGGDHRRDRPAGAEPSCGGCSACCAAPASSRRPRRRRRWASWTACWPRSAEAGLAVDLAVRGRPGRAGPRRGPDRLPDRAGGADQRAAALGGGHGRGHASATSPAT